MGIGTFEFFDNLLSIFFRPDFLQTYNIGVLSAEPLDDLGDSLLRILHKCMGQPGVVAGKPELDSEEACASRTSIRLVIIINIFINTPQVHTSSFLKTFNVLVAWLVFTGFVLTNE